MTIGLLADIKVKELLPVKMLLFLQASGDMALYPFLTLHMKSLGISLLEIGIQFAITPLAVLIATPMIGLLADRIGNFRYIIVISLLLSSIVGMLIMFVPKVKQVSVCSLNQQRLHLTCPSSLEGDNERDDFFLMSVPSCFEDSSSLEPGESLPIVASSIHNLQLNECSVVCKKKKLPSNLQKTHLATSNSKAVKWSDPDPSLPSFCLNSEEKKVYHCMSPVWNENIPFNNSLQLQISLSSTKMQIISHSTEVPTFENLTLPSTELNKRNNQLSKFTVAPASNKDSNLYQGVIVSVNREIPNDEKEVHQYQTIHCNSELRDDCYISCNIQPSLEFLNLKQKLEDDKISHQITFWIYLMLRITLAMIIATEMSLLKAAILTLVEKNDSEYGYQRIWGSISVSIVPFFTGLLMEKVDSGTNSQTFDPCFWVFATFKIIMAVICMFINLNVKPPSPNVWKMVGKLARRPEVALFLFFVGLIGSLWGFIETFIAWYLEEMNASRSLIGFNFTIAAVFGIPFSIFAGSIERRFGHVPIIIFGIFVYAFRLLGYAYAITAYQIVAIEMLDGITSTLLIVVMTTYASKLSSRDLIVTMQAAWAAMHFSVGRSLGSLFGGILMKHVGPHYTFLAFSQTAFFFGFCYMVVYRFYLRNLILIRTEQEKITSQTQNQIEFNLKNKAIMIVDPISNIRYGNENNKEWNAKDKNPSGDQSIQLRNTYSDLKK